MIDGDDVPLDCLVALLAERSTIDSNADGTLNSLNPFTYKATNDDVLHYGQMLKDPDREKFEEGMKAEMKGLVDAETYEVIHKSALPAGIKPIQAIWSFRRKCLPDWTISKWKAHLCPHGGQQEHSINYWETYAPVVNWSTVHLVLILSLLTGLASRQIDYVQAYTQAPLDCDLYMHVPAGFHVHNMSLDFSNGQRTNIDDQNYILKLRKNLYGLKQAGNNWFRRLRKGLLSRGFKQSKIDPCLFLRKDVVLVVYVDDCLLFARKPETLDNLITSLQQEFTLTDEGDVGAFLGLDIKRNEKGQLELT